MVGLTERHEKAGVILRELKQERYLPNHPVKKYFAKYWAERFFLFLENESTRAGKKIWLEKTPRHLQFIDLIEYYGNDAVFIHIIRDPVDVVSSIYQVTREHPAIWSGSRSIEACVKRYAADVRITADKLAGSNHYLVVYERLIADPEGVLRDVCSFLNVEFESSMLNYADSASQIIREEEIWKDGITKPLFRSQRIRFNEIFSDQEKAHVLEELKRTGAVKTYQKLLSVLETGAHEQ